MAEFYEMPAISPTMEMGTIVSWEKKEGGLNVEMLVHFNSVAARQGPENATACVEQASGQSE